MEVVGGASAPPDPTAWSTPGSLSKNTPCIKNEKKYYDNEKRKKKMKKKEDEKKIAMNS